MREISNSKLKLDVQKISSIRETEREGGGEGGEGGKVSLRRVRKVVGRSTQSL